MSVDRDFEAVLIVCREPFIGAVKRPGWKCRSCGWTVGGEGLPPFHNCPKDGEEQKLFLREKLEGDGA